MFPHRCPRQDTICNKTSSSSEVHAKRVGRFLCAANTTSDASGNSSDGASNSTSGGSSEGGRSEIRLQRVFMAQAVRPGSKPVSSVIVGRRNPKRVIVLRTMLSSRDVQAMRGSRFAIPPLYVYVIVSSNNAAHESIHAFFILLDSTCQRLLS